MSCDPTANGFQFTENYVLGPGGEQVTELAQDANGSMNWQRTYVYAGGALIATYGPVPNPAYSSTNTSVPQTLYLPSFRFTDWLGTMRATTDSTGVAQGTCTGLPFGDSVTCQGDIPDPHHFTGKERDSESGNDYFFARYYSSAMGRFLSPDWAAKATPVPYAKLDDPQTLNLYGYLRNNPLGGVDADGHCGGGPNDPPCNQVKVTVTPTKEPLTVETRTQTLKAADGTSQTVTTTGPQGKDLQFTVKVNGTPTDGVSVHETNQNTMTTSVAGTNSDLPKVESNSATQNGGTFPDTVGTGYTPQQLAAGNATTQDAKDAFNLVPTTLVDKQTLTLGIPAIGGQSAFTCQATDTRTITNTSDGKTISPGGYTLTTTQPVVTNP